MRFDLEELENKLNNIEKMSNETKIIELNNNSLNETFLYDRDSIIELYMLFIMFSLFTINTNKLNVYDVD